MNGIGFRRIALAQGLLNADPARVSGLNSVNGLADSTNGSSASRTTLPWWEMSSVSDAANKSADTALN
jgi:hypothetical protein